MSYDVNAVRAQFPSLSTTDDGTRRIYLDNPAGTQVPRSVADAVADCLVNRNANLGGHFETSKLADAVVENARSAMADLLNAPSDDEIMFGQNMTSMTFHMASSIGQALKAGDEIIVSEMDHDANIQPWVMMARDHDLAIRWLPFNVESFEFDVEELNKLLNDRTRLLCIGGASNLTGTLHDLKSICAKARAAGAWTYIDGVQSVPHVSTDVQDIGCDFLACSAYKFFGPHQGILWGRAALLESLEPYKVRPSPAEIPWCFETGTQSIECMAGTTAAVDYFAAIGSSMASDYMEANSRFDGRRQALHAAMDLLFAYEQTLAEHLIDGLESLNGVTVQGVTARDALDRRVPTVSFTADGHSPSDIASSLAQENIFVWDGHNYALEVVKALGIEKSGGTVRVGPVHYNTLDELDELLNKLENILH